MNDDGDVMMQNSSQLKEINKALMGNANRVQEMSVGERLICSFIYAISFITYGIIIIIVACVHTSVLHLFEKKNSLFVFTSLNGSMNEVI